MIHALNQPAGSFSVEKGDSRVTLAIKQRKSDRTGNPTEGAVKKTPEEIERIEQSKKTTARTTRLTPPRQRHFNLAKGAAIPASAKRHLRVQKQTREALRTSTQDGLQPVGAPLTG
jgi:hypothetical protein